MSRYALRCSKPSLVGQILFSATLTPGIKRGRDANATLGETPALLFVRERIDPGKLFSFQEFERGAASGGDVRDFVGYFGGIYGRDGIAAAYDRNRAAIVGDSMSDLEGAAREAGNLEDSH